MNYFYIYIIEDIRGAMSDNELKYINGEIDFHTYLVKEINRVGKNTNDSNDDEYFTILNNVNDLGPQDAELFNEIESRLGNKEGGILYNFIFNK
jgi:hypothetical protein